MAHFAKCQNAWGRFAYEPVTRTIRVNTSDIYTRTATRVAPGTYNLTMGYPVSGLSVGDYVVV